MSKAAVIIGTQRCGSNYFLSVCRRFKDVLTLGELYHRGGVWPFRPSPPEDFAFKQELGSVVNRLFPGEFAEYLEGQDLAAAFTPESNKQLDSALVRFSHKFPNRYFDSLRALAGDRPLLFKIFPEHLDLRQLLSLLREQRPRVLLMLRDPLDSFISFKKLSETKKPQDVDTSELKIRFDKGEYYTYKAALATHYRAVKEFCDDEWIDLDVVHYEWLHASEADKVDKVQRVVENLFKTKLHWADDKDKFKIYKKQDASPSVADKVLNPAQLPRKPQQILCD
jgi:hypothetical protein